MYVLNEQIIKSDEKIPIKAHLNDSDIDDISADSHFHNEIELIYILKGAAEYSVEGDTVHVKEGQLIIFNESVEHSSRMLEPSRIVLLQFKLSMLRDFFAHKIDAINDFFAGNFKYLIIDIGEHKECEALPQLMLSTVEEINDKGEAYELSIISNILKILTLLLRAGKPTPAAGRSAPVSDEIIQYIADNYRNDIKIADVAAHFHFSVSYFSHLFKNITGTSFVKYLNTYRINISKKLLMNPKNTITGAMVQVGITNRSYYNRLFKRTTGFTPQEFRDKFFKTQKGTK